MLPFADCLKAWSRHLVYSDRWNRKLSNRPILFCSNAKFPMKEGSRGVSIIVKIDNTCTNSFVVSHKDGYYKIKILNVLAPSLPMLLHMSNSLNETLELKAKARNQQVSYYPVVVLLFPTHSI